MPNYVPGIGPLGSVKLMAISDYPGKYEDMAGEPMVGPTGQMFDNFLVKAGSRRDEIYITNVYKYRPPLNDIKQYALIGYSTEQAVKELWEEIRRVKPNCILILGGEALQSICGLSGILNYRGSILTAIDGITKCVVTLNPAALFSHGENNEGLQYVYSQLIQSDISRAIEESNTSSINLPDRQLVVASNSLDLYRYTQEYRSLEKVVIDIESINCIPVCLGLAFNKYHAISVPLLPRIGKIELTTMGTRDLIECYRILDEILRTKLIIGQNLKYDHFKLSLVRFRILRIFSDTLIKTRVLFPELPKKNLHVQSSIWTREPYYKEEGKEFKLGKSPLKQLFLYNAKDCAVTFEVDEEQEKDLISMQESYQIPLVSYYYDYQMKKHNLYLEMENNGFAVDHLRQKELKVKYKELSKIQHDKLTFLVGHEVNVKSPPQKMALFRELGMTPYKKNPTSEDAIVKMIGNHCKGKDGPHKKAVLEGILEETRIRDQESRYINFVPDYDGRCKSSFNIIATETCRSSTSVPKKPIRPIKSGLAFHTISKHGRLAKDIRSMFIPDKGKVFLQVDASTAEPRVVAVLCKDYVLLKAFDTVDIHRRTAALVLGMTSILDLSEGAHISDKIGKDSPERFCGKKTRNGGNYDMKKARFMTEVNTDAQKFEIDLSISEWKGGQMLDLFHAASPLIRRVFHQDIKDAIDSSRTIIDPFGGIRVFFGEMNDSLYQEAYANIPQRTIAHLVQGAALKTHAELGDLVGPVKTHPINFISENHDSLLLQIPEKMIDEVSPVINKHMTAPIDFSKYCTLKRNVQLVIPCDLEVTDVNYGTLEKYSKFKERRVSNIPEIANSSLSLAERMRKLREIK